MTIAPSADFSYYTNTIYWNDFEIVNSTINKAISGQEWTGWIEHFRRTYGVKENTLVINCGNGWVERELFQQGAISHVEGTDINASLIAECKRAAKDISMPSVYRMADANTFDVQGKTYDLVVNYAAMHHVARLNRMSEVLADATRSRGLFINYDYTGPHRNQYDMKTWLRCCQVRRRLPTKYQTVLGYPHVPTMLATDPSEAVHSELFDEVLHRHFDVLETVRLGGGIAYVLLFQNAVLQAEQNTREGQAAIKFILEEDRALTQEHPASNLFTFSVARAKNPAPDASQRAEWQAEEDERESRARSDGGRYYQPTPLELIL